jgi:hypothetical protein
MIHTDRKNQDYYTHYFILFLKELLITGNHRKPKQTYDPLGTLFKER